MSLIENKIMQRLLNHDDSCIKVSAMLESDSNNYFQNTHKIAFDKKIIGLCFYMLEIFSINISRIL